MKNHWLNKNKDKQAEVGLDAVCNEIIDIGNLQINADYSKFEDITFSTVGTGQTALAELDMELSDGSIKYSRETDIGPFTFKDAGELGLDIFFDGKKIGWINSKGEESLKDWLHNKQSPKVLAPKNTYSGTQVVSNECINSGTQVVSNEYIKSCDNVYQFAHANIVPGSVLFTAYVNNLPVQSENLRDDGMMIENYSFTYTIACERPVIKSVILDHTTGTFIVDWVNHSEHNHLSVCYEYRGEL